MPFTFSHPAIVLPFINRRKRYFSATGLIIGSIIPDFESFIRLNVNKPHSHTWLGIFWFDLPLAIIAAFLFHNLVRDSLIQNLPDVIRGKFVQFEGYNWNKNFRRNYMYVVVSMLIGIFSHLLWDSFTHLNLRYPGINASKLLVFNTQLHAILQDASSVIGIIIVTWFVIRMPNDITAGVSQAGEDHYIVGVKDKLFYWLSVVVFASCILFVLTIHLRRPINIILKIDLVISSVLAAFLATAAVQKLLYKES